MGSRPLRLLRPTLALVALLALAACTAGVPKTGDVVSVSPVTTAAPQEDADALKDLGSPTPGQSEVEVATGYMRAMSTGDVERVQRWVTTDARDRLSSWEDPATTVRVYSVFEPGPPEVRGDGRRVVESMRDCRILGRAFRRDVAGAACVESCHVRGAVC